MVNWKKNNEGKGEIPRVRIIVANTSSIPFDVWTGVIWEQKLAMKQVLLSHLNIGCATVKLYSEQHKRIKYKYTHTHICFIKYGSTDLHTHMIPTCTHTHQTITVNDITLFSVRVKFKWISCAK